MASHDSVSKYWYITLPLLLGIIIAYAYQSGTFFGNWIASLVDPLIRLGGRILNFIFGV